MKKSLLKNTFVRTTFLMLMSALVLTSCKKDNTEPSPASGTEFTVPVCNPIITEGCDPMNHVIDTMDFPYIDINQLIGGGAAAGEKEKSIWASLGTFLLQQGGSTLLGVFTKPLANMLSTAIFGGDGVSEKLDMVLDKLNVIEQDMNTLIAMTQQTLMLLDGNQYDGLHRYYTAFQDLLTGLTVENRICEANLKLIYDNLQNYSEEELNAAVAEVMRNWGDRPIAGFSAYGAFDQLYNKLVDSGPMYYGALRNIFSVYDVIVFHNTPWEKTGYDMRDMFRAAVAAETVRTAWLTNLYYRTVRPNDFQYFTSGLTTKIENLSTLFASSSNSVNRRYDRVVCQLSGALFILDADALEEHKGWTFTKNNAYYPLNGTKHVFSQGTITSTSNDANITAARNSQLTNSQIRQITAYYEPKFGRDYTILNCLEDGGLIVPSYYNTIFINNNGNPYNIQYYEDVYLLSQETTMNLYLGPNCGNVYYFICPIRGNILLRLSGLYNVGIPLSCTEAAGFSCLGYLPDFHKDSFYCEGNNSKLYGLGIYEEYLQYYEYFYNQADQFTIDGVTYDARLTKWHAGKGYTYTFPGKYVLWFRTGSLQLYDHFSFDI